MDTIFIDKTEGGIELISRIRAGDRQAETELVERYKRIVISIISRKLGDIAVADDL